MMQPAGAFPITGKKNLRAQRNCNGKQTNYLFGGLLEFLPLQDEIFG
jgi:hypothetical protein